MSALSCSLLAFHVQKGMEQNSQHDRQRLQPQPGMSSWRPKWFQKPPAKQTEWTLLSKQSAGLCLLSNLSELGVAGAAIQSTSGAVLCEGELGMTRTSFRLSERALAHQL